MDVGDEFANAVVGDIRWGGRSAVASLVGRDGPKTGVSQRGQLVPPGISDFGKAVQENNWRPFPLLVNGHFQPICRYCAGLWEHPGI